MVFFSTAVNAQNSKSLESPRKTIIYFDLPSQMLQTGLIEFAIQSNFTVIVESDIVEGFRSQTLVGPHDPIEALTILLTKTPFTFIFQEATKSIVIKPAIAIDTDTNDQPPLLHIPNNEPEEIVVTGVQYPFLYNTISNSQIYGNTSLFNTARFISVLPTALISDQAPNDLTDLLKMSSSITPGDGMAESNDDFYLRGFPRYGIYMDGVRQSSNTGIKQFPVNMERVEILKGPSTLFYGQAEPGGIVNVVRKKPQSTPHQIFTLAKGTDNKEQASIDLTGELFSTTLKQSQYRLIMADETQDTYSDLKNLSRQLFAPSLSITMEKNTSIDIAYNYQQNRQTREQGTIIVVPLGQTVDIVAVKEPAHQAQPDFKTKHHQINIGLQHYFESGWSLKSNLAGLQEQRYGIRTTRNTLLTSNLLSDGDDLDPTQVFITLDGISFPIPIGTRIKQDGKQDIPVATIRSIYDENSEEKMQYLKTLLDGSVNLVGITHDLSMGVDWYRQNIAEEFALEHRSDIISLTQIKNVSANANEIIEGVFNTNKTIGELTTREHTLRYNDYGAFLLDSIELNDYWRSSIGGRYTQTTGEYQKANSAQQEELTAYNAFSAELGLRYEPIEELAFYANYSEGLKANYQVDDLGTTLTTPETSYQYELGAKALLFNGALVSTIATYQINKENVVAIEFIDGVRKAVIGGEQSTTGIDIDFTYQMTQNINLLGSFSIITPEIRSGEYAENTPALASKHVASTFFSYRFRNNWAEGLGLHVG